MYGIKLIENFISIDEENFLIQKIDEQPRLWLNDLKRRVQHYGYKYDYTKKFASRENNLGPMPDWLIDFCNNKIVAQNLMQPPEQIIINEYITGQSIGMHIDRIDSFGPIVASLSLLDSCNMKFTKNGFDPINKEEKTILLPRRSLLVLADEARYKWAHGIPTIKSNRRVSITFRTMQFNTLK